MASRLNLSPKEFLEWTPKEIQSAIEVWTQDRELLIREQYEMTRMSVYYSYLLAPVYKKGVNKKNYQQFKNDYFTLPWDEKTEEINEKPKEVNWDELEKTSLRGKGTQIKTVKAEDLI